VSDTLSGLRRKITGAGDLRTVVRTMKAVAASNIGQYERSVHALAEYYRTLELGLGACIREKSVASVAPEQEMSKVAVSISAIVFGSDQGLVGQFNDLIADYALKTMGTLAAKTKVWAVGGRVGARLQDSGLPAFGLLSVPNSVAAITPLVGQILVNVEGNGRLSESSELDLFYNRPLDGSSYAPVHQRLLPLDGQWQHKVSGLSWPSKVLPEVLGSGSTTLRAFIREYLFVSLFRACAESLASENASRLAAMQRADKNIVELLDGLNGSYYRLRQSGIDEELFDVISGFEALSSSKEFIG
jgi:F-type H+-transporting ATPase subunit gamma